MYPPWRLGQYPASSRRGRGGSGMLQLSHFSYFFPIFPVYRPNFARWSEPPKWCNTNLILFQNTSLKVATSVNKTLFFDFQTAKNIGQTPSCGGIAGSDSSPCDFTNSMTDIRMDCGNPSIVCSIHLEGSLGRNLWKRNRGL